MENDAGASITEPSPQSELEAAIVAVYRGPLDGFVARRDALVKQLRAAKHREAADRVKSLRKPSRMAWVLDALAHENSASIEQLAAAIGAAQTSTDLRAALETVKATVREVAAATARIAIRAGQPIDANAIAAAVHAVIGNAGAFAELRAGRLVDVPEGGGLDMLAAIQVIVPASTGSSSPPSREPVTAAPRAEPATQDAELARAAQAERERAMRAERERAARAELHRVETLLANARKGSEHAGESVRHARERLDVAERELLKAQAEVQTRRADVERVLQDATVAASAMGDAERAVTAARARLVDGTEGEDRDGTQ